MPYCSRVALPVRRHFSRLSVVLGSSVAIASSCGAPSTEGEPAVFNEPKNNGTSIEVSEFDINANGIDRFVNCPPPGELGQDWIPPLPPWSAPPLTGPIDPSQLPPDDVTMHGNTPTERAIADTRDHFRACYNHGLIYDPTQDGHVAIVLRVGADGRVAEAEAWGACEIVAESIECMRDAGKKLRFRPPAGGSDTITIPAVFTSSTAVRNPNPRPNDVYTAAAYIAVEKLRPQLHACEKSAHQPGRSIIASATFNLDVDSKGNVRHSNVEPWSGDKDLLACAASALATLSLPAPAGGRASVIVRLSFNPRVGTK
jgi:hypothetical protein